MDAAARDLVRTVASASQSSLIPRAASRLAARVLFTTSPIPRHAILPIPRPSAQTRHRPRDTSHVARAMYHSAARAHRHAIPRSLSLSSRGSSHPRPSLLPINPFPVFPLPPATFSTDASTSSHAPNHAPPPPPPIPLKSGQSSHPSVPSSFSAQTQPSRQGGQQGQGTQHPSSVLSEVSPTPTIPSLATSAQPSKPIELRRTKPDLAVQLVKDAAKKSSREQQASIGATAAASTTTTALADAVAASSATATPAVAPVAEKKSLWVRVKEEAVHYWHGTKLLGAEIKISSRLLLKLLRGGGLTRREHKQLLRTVADLVRLVPFIVLLIIPFAELALPFLLRFFPNMLPSTFESKFAEEEKRMKLVKVRLEMAKFLQDTITEVWVTEGTNQGTAVKEFNEFFKKYRGSEQLAPTEEIVRIARKFDESLTLDNLTHNQLISLSRFMSLNAFGSDNFLRYQIRMKLRDIKRDDQMIATEGISALNLDEVRAAASQRGIRTVGISPARLRQELQQWLDLSLNYKIPGTLLLLSRALAYDKPIPVSVNTPEALQAALQSLPEAALVEAETQIAEAAGEKVDYKRRLELIRKQEELIQLELEQVQREKAEHAAAKAREQEAQAAEKAKLLAQAQAGAAAAVKMWEGVPQAEAAAQEQTTAPVPVEIRPVQIPEQQLRALGEALQAMGSPSALDPEREELETLKHERREYEEDIGEIQTMTGGKSAESSTSRYLGKRLERLISKIDQELKHYDKDIGDKLNLLKPDEYGQVTVAQLEEALKVINAHKDNPEIAQIVEFLDQNHDGLVVLKEVIDFARKAEQVGQEKEGESGTYSGQSGLTGDIISAARTILHEEQAQRNTKNGAAQTETESPLPSGTASNSSKDGRTEH